MNSTSYERLFRKLGFRDITRGKTLKHPDLSLSIYFNRSKDEFVYFTTYVKDRACLEDILWDFIAPQQKKDDRPELVTVVPKKGLEAAAFRDLLSSPLRGEHVQDLEGETLPTEAAPASAAREPETIEFSQSDQFRHDVALQFHRNASYGRGAVFGSLDAKYHPIGLTDDARQMTLGFVGRNYRPCGLVFLGINPGGGGDAYTVRTPEDELFYQVLGQFSAANATDLDTSFDHLTEVFQRVVQRWNLWRILSAALEAGGVTLSEVAYLNAVPYRTRQDQTPPASAKDRAWDLITGPTISLLNPRLVIALGNKAGEVLQRTVRRGALTPQIATLTIERSIGDRYITSGAQRQLETLRAVFRA